VATVPLLRCITPAIPSSARRSSPRCRRWPSAPAPSTSARASPTPTARPRSPTRRSLPSAPGHNQYPPGPGIPELRQAIADAPARFYGLDVDPDTEVLVTAGATEAIAAHAAGAVRPGDEVVAFEPYYDSYAATIAMAGATLRVVTLRPPTTASIPTSCGRPSGPATADPAQLAAQPDRQGVRPRRAHAASPSCASSTTSSRHRRGLRAPRVRRAHVPLATLPGMPSAPHDLVGRQDVLLHRLEDRLGVRPAGARRRGPHRQAVPHLRQRGAVPARRRRRPPCPTVVLRRLLADMRAKRDRLCRASRPPGSTYWPGRAPTSSPPTSRPLGIDDGRRFCLELPERCGVVAVPNVVFYDDETAGAHLIRFTFCKRCRSSTQPSSGSRRWRSTRRDADRRRRPARHRVGGPRRHHGPHRPPHRRRSRARRSTHRADRDVRRRVLDEHRAHRPSRPKGPARPSSSTRRPGPAPTCAGRCRSSATATTARATRSWSPGPTARSTGTPRCTGSSTRSTPDRSPTRRRRDR
jgi:N-succinyldiaminopimelate aminotransferase